MHLREGVLFNPRLKRLKFLPLLDFSPEAVFSARDHIKADIIIYRLYIYYITYIYILYYSIKCIAHA